MSELSREGANDATFQYLRYYCDPSNELDHAVMVRGNWGAGKTHFINAFIAELKRSGRDKILYVSLYGVTSFRQIEDALFRQLHPVLSSRGMKIAASVAKSVLKGVTKIDLNGDGKEDFTLTSSVPEIDLLDYFKTPSECLLIFDDLERCSMNVSDVLGYINAFVEHEGFKVIIVANEDEILKRGQSSKQGSGAKSAKIHEDEVLTREDTKYERIKEKLIGQTVTVRSDIAAALGKFLDLIKNPRTKEYVMRHEQTLRLLYSQSETDNLRLLKYALRDFERLAASFTETHWSNDEVVGILFRKIIALSIEVRSGRLAQNALVAAANESRVRLFRKPDDPKSSGDQLRERYPEVEFDQQLLTAEWLSRLFFEGYLDEEQTRRLLDSSSFYNPESVPAWKIAWHGWEATDERFEAAVKVVEEQFRKREFSAVGELLQIFGLRLWFSEMEAVTQTKNEIVTECKTYVDDLRTAGRLPEDDHDRFGDRAQSWEGLGFYLIESSEFKETRDYLYSSMAESFRSSLPAKGLKLLELMKTDAQAYFRELCLNSVTASPFFDVPILASIEPKVFVSEVLTLDPVAQSTVFATFQGRYSNGRLNAELQAEKQWLASVKMEFLERMPSFRSMSRNRLRNRIGHSIDPFLPVEWAS
jgi:hypothetical protein